MSSEGRILFRQFQWRIFLFQEKIKTDNERMRKMSDCRNISISRNNILSEYVSNMHFCVDLVKLWSTNWTIVLWKTIEKYSNPTDRPTEEEKYKKYTHPLQYTQRPRIKIRAQICRKNVTV